MPESKSIHIRHQVTPEYVCEMLEVLSVSDEFDSVSSIIAAAGEFGFSISSFSSERGTGADILEVMRKMGLVQKFALTESGRELVRIGRDKRQLVLELLHFLLYSGRESGERDGIHWGYRQACALLWRDSGTSFNRDALAAQVVERAQNELGYRPAYSANSIEGVLNWLRALDPPVMAANGQTFRRRGFCPPELLLLGIDDFYRQRGIDYQSNLPMNSQTRNTLMRLCLLEPESFDRVLTWAVDQFPVLRSGSKGFAGHHVLLERRVAWRDVCP